MHKKLLKLLFGAIILLLSSSDKMFAQVLINEICPSNISLIQNSNGKYDDWIELYNAGGAAVNLSGYGLTDDITKPYRFTFPSYSLGAGKRVVVFASDSNSSVLVNHWEMGVNALSSWKYVIGSASIDTNWRNTSFNDASWSSGNGGIGVGDGDDNTTIAITSSVYMRKTFTISDTSQILKAVFMMDYDDGFAAYLNGVEIARANLGIAGTRPRWNDLAPSSHEAMMYQGGQPDSFYVDPVFLKTIIRQGTNVLTIETHNQATNSSDMSSIPYLFFGMLNSGTTFTTPPPWFRAPANDYYNAKFKLSRTGETIYLSNASSTFIDQKTYLAMDIDNSFGRKPDGTSTWCYFSTPTPALSNNSSTCYSGYASPPVFSLAGGFYSSSRTLTLSNSTPGGVIRYTTNGNDPTSSSTAYSSAITISSTKTIRARVFASGYLPSPIITNTYFINENIKLPVFTMTTDSLNLWDYNTGIYVLGPNAEAASPYFGANFWQSWQKPASIEYFDKSKNRILKFDGEIEIFGNYSRAKPQKSFEIKLSDRYGLSEINYPIIPDKSYITKYDNIILRNSGTDWNVVHFRDALMERIMKNTYSGYLAAEPAVLFLNGAYWGVYTIHEKHDENWMSGNFGLSKNEIDYLRESGSSVVIAQGSDATFWSMYNYATTQNASTQQYYDYMNSVLDIKNYADYFIAETYYNNGDWIGEWTNNIKIWRPNAPGSKWKYLLYDTDFGFGLKGSVNDNRLEMARNPIEFSHSSEMFDAILANPTFKRYFINRYADLINTIYLPANVSSALHSYQDSMSFDMPAHFTKWGSNMSTWQSNINSLMSFVNARPTIMRDFIRSGFSLTSKVTLTLQTSPAGSGRIEISTITPTSYPWSGIYFNGNPVTITAIPNPGYTFDHWRSNVVINSNNTNQSVTYNFTANDVITCYFTGSAATPKLTISEVNYNSDGANNSGDWVELHNYGTQALNISGWKFSDEADNHVFQFPTGTTIAAGGYLVLVEDTSKFRIQFPTITNKIGPMGFNLSNAGELVRLFDYQNNLYLSFTYQDIAPWPTTPDGGGYTLELVSPTGNLNSGTNWFAGCLGGSPGRAYSPLLATPVSVTGNTTFCTGGSVQLSATSTAGYAYQWKRNSTDISGAVSANYTANLAGSYTVAVTYQGCSVISDPTVVTVVTQGPSPVTTSDQRCGPGQLTLTATSTDSIYWYDAPNGALVGTGNSFTTPVINSTTVYYSKSSINCPSSPVAATATILVPAAAPVTSDVTRCGPGIVTLNATDTAAIRWYNALNGGAQIETGTSFVTNILNNDTVFYVEAGSVCPSPRVEVFAFVNTSPIPTTANNFRCNNGTVVLDATGSGTLTWYNMANGGSSLGSGTSFTTPSLSATDTFYVEANAGCPSPRAQAIAFVEQILPAPTGSGASSCDSGSFALSVTSAGTVYWYDSPSGGVLLSTGSNYSTAMLYSSVTYYVEAGEQCRSPRTTIQAQINSAPATPSASSVPRCGPGTVDLSAGSTGTNYWYSAVSGGTLLYTGNSFTTPAISSTTTYYVEAGNGNCRSARTSVQAIVNSVPPGPGTSNVARCGPGSVTLTASSGETIYWFDVGSGGTALSSGTSFVTPSLSSTTTYYVEAGNTCRSARIPVQAIITSAPSVPTGADVNRCGSGTVTLNATGVGTLSWYAAATGGGALTTGSSYTTPSLSSSTTYYVESDNGCQSSSRLAIQAIVDPIPVAPTSSNVARCGTGTVALTATGSGSLYWYSAATGGTSLFTGGTFTTPSLNFTTTYYVETGGTCRSSRIPVQAIINSFPAVPVTSNVSRCGTGTVILSATSSEAIYWFDVASGGTQIGTGNTFTTPSISSTTTYYVETGNNCRSTRISVQAIISSAPPVPTGVDVNRCGPGTFTLNATGTGTLSWFAASTGGSALTTGSSYTTPSLSSNTTYYVEANNGCQSASRLAIQAIVDPIPAAPSSSNVSRCGTGAVSLTATGSGSIYWYSAATGGTSLFTGGTYTTGSLNFTTTYYVETGGTCRSSRIPVQAIINSFPAAPVASNVSRCGTGTVVLSATSSETIYWFDVASGGTQLGTGNTFTTPSISSTTTYYVETGNNCRSTRISVQAIISASPSVPTGADVSRCGTGTVVLSASGAGTLNWYAAATGGTLLSTGTNYTTPSITANTTYYVEANNGCVSPSRLAIQAIVDPVPTAPTASDVSRCGPGTFSLSATGSGTIYWYSAATGGTLLFTGSPFATPSLSNSTSYYVETGAVCRSSRTSVQAIVNTIPPGPTAFNISRCDPGTVVLTASSTQAISWFDQPSGGVLLGTGSSYTTPVISTTTTYYAEAGAVCPGPRTAVQAIINTPPAAPTGIDGSRCGSGTVSISATSASTINWYAASSGGSILGTGATFTTPSLSSNTTYYAGANNGCPSATRTAVQAIISPIPAAPSASNVYRCGPGVVGLSAISTEQIYWYDAATGGSLLQTGSTFSTPSISSTTIYYVETGNTCRSSRTAVQAIITAIPAAPLASDVSRCGSGTVTLSASSALPISWFALASGGSAVGTGTSYTTPSLSNTTTYYVETGTTCLSPRIAVQAIISVPPAIPVLTTGSRCGTGSVVLSGSATTRINWYSAASGGIALDTGNTFNTPVISSTTTFYADAGQGCNSARVPVVATVTSLPAAPTTADSSRCGSGVVTLGATSSEQIYWYTVSSGGTSVATGATYTTPSISTTTIYYVETGNNCRSLRVAVNAIITSPAAMPSSSDVSRCGPGAVTFTAVSSQTMRWYDHATGGPVLFTGSSYTTPSLTSNETYYVEAGDACPSSRRLVNAIITSVPPVPLLNDNSRCGTGSVLLSGSSSQQINWYDSLSGGTLLGIGSTFNTPNIAVNTVFYADAGIGCNSARVAVNATINPLPASPTVLTDTACGSGSLSLSASSPEQIYWYDSAVGGLLLDSGTTFNTPNISSTTLYFVETGDNCRSIRRSVAAVIVPFSQFLIIENGFGCGMSAVDLSANSSDPVYWYDAASGGNLVGSGINFTTPILNSSQTYYAVTGDRCPSQAIPVIATIYPATSVSLGPDTIIVQSGQSVTLDAGPGYSTYVWSTGDSTQSLQVHTTGTYTITVTDSNGCSASDYLFVEVLVGVTEAEINSTFSMYPNPVHHILYITWNSLRSSKAQMQVFSLDGRLMLFRDLRSVNGEFSDKFYVNKFAAGIYMMRITDEKETFTTRFVVE